MTNSEIRQAYKEAILKNGMIAAAEVLLERVKELLSGNHRKKWIICRLANEIDCIICADIMAAVEMGKGGVKA